MAAQHLGAVWPLTPQQQRIFETKLKEAPGVAFTKAAISVETVPHPLNDLAKFLVGKDKKVRPHQELSASASEPVADEDVLSSMHQFVDHGLWHAVITLSSSVLTNHGQGPAHQNTNVKTLVHTEETLQVWLLRVVALWKMRHYTTVATELATFKSFDEADLRYEFYPEKYPGKTGSMVPFALRVIHAEICSVNGQHMDSLDRLYVLLHTCQIVRAKLLQGQTEGGEEPSDDNDDKKTITMFQHRIHRINFGIGNCLLAQKDFSLAMDVFEAAITDDVSKAEASAIFSGLGRIALELGDVKTAKKYFDQAACDGDDTTSAMDAGMVALCEGDYKNATAHFTQAWEKDHTNTCAGNNMAVCMLYKGLLAEATTSMTSVLEGLKPALDEILVFNICTLYELQTNAANERKRVFVPLAVEHTHDAFDLKSLKLSGIPQSTTPVAPKMLQPVQPLAPSKK
eukprot:m.134692 g.134692  ORF g.134692 m.134692 type:complete len:456 (-) comp29752_c0_seq2:61-1428(-)